LSDLVCVGIYKTSFNYKRQDPGIVMMSKAEGFGHKA